MSNEISKEHVGKYVCYQRADGGACWGRVKDQGFVNTLKGEREVLILTERYVRYERTKNLKEFAYFFPDVLNDPHNKKAMRRTEDGLENFHPEEIFYEVRKVPGDSTLRLEEINAESDLMELDEFLEIVDEKTLFEALLAGRTVEECLEESKDDQIVPAKNEKFVLPLMGADGNTSIGESDSVTDGGSGAFGVTAIEIGLRHMIREDEDLRKKVIAKVTDVEARKSLAERFGIEIE
jgi:hypothetical protein